LKVVVASAFYLSEMAQRMVAKFGMPMHAVYGQDFKFNVPAREDS